jgi:hypothetical protein
MPSVGCAGNGDAIQPRNSLYAENSTGEDFVIGSTIRY